MRRKKLLPCFYALLVFIAVIANFILPTAAVSEQAAAVPQYGKFETSFSISGQAGNPFDPAVNDVLVSFRGPRGLTAVIPAFWDGNYWRVRYAPSMVGNYTFFVKFNGKAVNTADLSGNSFHCVKSDSDGFVRCDPNNIQSFQFDSGKLYYPIGMDVAWRGEHDLSYPDVFAKMSAAHMNWARIWMNYWDGKDLEWTLSKQQTPKIGYYSMDVARHWDDIMDSAAQNGIYVQMTVQHHGEYTRLTDPNWQDNPFNVANGGFLKEPADFFTDPEAIRLTKNKLRYIVARWGYSSHLLSFELFNEVQNIGEAQSHFQDVVNWHKTMAAYIRSIDPYHHLITTSNSDPGLSLANIGLDYDQQHSYPPDLISVFGNVKTDDLKVPFFFGEWGYSGTPTDAQGRILMHDGLWSGAMIPAAGASQFWYWDYVESRNWWPEFSSLTSYVDAYNVSQWTGLARVSPTVDTHGETAGLTFAPTGGWEPTTRFDIDVPVDGAMPDMHGVASFIQGRYHREMTAHPLVFHVTCAKPSRFILTVTTVASAGASLTLGLDGNDVSQQDFPAAAKDHDVNTDVGVDIPAGSHTVTVVNNGLDWLVAGKFTVTNLVPIVALLAKGNSRKTAFWAYDRNVFEERPHSATLRFSNLHPGKYVVHLWDTKDGQPKGDIDTKSTESGGLEFTLPPFTQDIAGVIVAPVRSAP
jgi:hypothetical protein